LLQEQATIVCISSQFATDRILLHSTFLEGIEPLARPLILSDAVREASFPKEHLHSGFFQPVQLPIGFSGEFTLLRHFENFLWDHKGLSTSRESQWRLRKRGESPMRDRAIRAAAKPFSYLGVESWAEDRLASALIAYASPRKTVDWLAQVAPAAVVAMNPFIESQMATIAAAKRLKVPVVAFITSWDNITTKPRMIYEYDGYIAWSEQMQRELHEFYPQSRGRRIDVVGAPQYDVFFRPEYRLTREEFFGVYGLDPERPVVLYCLGSPNMIREDHGALQYIEQAHRHPALARTQTIIRAHPGHLESKLTEFDKIRASFPDVVIQGPGKHWERFPFQGEQAVIEWVNTIRHADVVINLASTMTVDAAIFDKPVVNIDFDPEPGGPNHQMVKEINRSWNHFSPIAQSGGVWNVTTVAEMVAATETYLSKPELHRERRRWIVDHVCGPVDGQAGRRMAEAIIDIINQPCAS
jgi:hypothetical protein